MREMAKHVVGYYDTEAEAIKAVEELKQQGYSAQDISIISKNVSDVDAISN
ncbi:MAG: general stress protein, partial [Solibacillus isronensis]